MEYFNLTTSVPAVLPEDSDSDDSFTWEVSRCQMKMVAAVFRQGSGNFVPSYSYGIDFPYFQLASYLFTFSNPSPPLKPEFWHHKSTICAPQKGLSDTMPKHHFLRFWTPLFSIWTPHFPHILVSKHHFFKFQHPAAHRTPPPVHVLSQLRAGQDICTYIIHIYTYMYIYICI